MIVTDHILNMIMAAGAVIAIPVAITIYILQKVKKNITCIVQRPTDLLTIKKQLQGKVKVTYEGTEVENIQVLTVTVINGGNSSIVTDDFEEPLKITFNNRVKILSVKLVSTRPKDLAVKFTAGMNEIVIEPLLLNKKDTLQLEITLSGHYTSVECSGRIKDIVKIKRLGREK